MKLKSIRNLWGGILLASLHTPRNLAAAQVLSVQSIQTCDNTTDIALSRFNLTYYVPNNALYFDTAGASNRKLLNATANLTILLYGSPVYSTFFDLCKFNESTLCPIQPNTLFNITTWQILPANSASKLPSFLFGLPDLGFQSKVTIQSPTLTNTSLCILTTMASPGAKSLQSPITQWLSLGLLFGVILNSIITFLKCFVGDGPLATAVSSPSFPRATDVILFFQYVSYTGQMSLNYPELYRAFTLNFGWAMGLISLPFIENAASTGTFQNSTMSHWINIVKRDAILPVDAPSNYTVEGIKSYVDALNIPSTYLFMTTLLVFAFLLAILTALMFLLWIMIGLLAVAACLQWNKVKLYAVQWPWLYVGYASRLALMALPPLLTYACYQYAKPVSTLSTDLSCVILVLYAILLCATTFFILRAARRNTLFTNAINPLRYGYLYSSYQEPDYMFFIPMLLYTVGKALVLGLAQENGEAQAIANLCIESLLLIALLFLRPYKGGKANLFQCMMSFVRVIGFALLVTCATVFAVDVATKSKLGLALVVLHSATGAILYILMILNIIFNVLQGRRLKNQKLAPEEKISNDGAVNTTGDDDEAHVSHTAQEEEYR